MYDYLGFIQIIHSVFQLICICLSVAFVAAFSFSGNLTIIPGYSDNFIMYFLGYESVFGQWTMKCSPTAQFSPNFLHHEPDSGQWTMKCSPTAQFSPNFLHHEPDSGQWTMKCSSTAQFSLYFLRYETDSGQWTIKCASTAQFPVELLYLFFFLCQLRTEIVQTEVWHIVIVCPESILIQVRFRLEQNMMHDYGSE